jgi:hypothetical protein
VNLPRSRAKALARGLPRYRTGKPCLNGHRAPRLTSNRHCTMCHSKRGQRGVAEAAARRSRDLLYTALRRKHRNSSAFQRLGAGYEEFRAYIAEFFVTGMSWDNYGEWHLDHRRPLSSFDLTDPAQLAQALHHTNYRPLWASDNLSKGTRIDWPTLAASPAAQ